MVVNGEKIFFFEYHPFEKRGWVNPMGGGYFLKKVWREALFATPRPVLGHPPLPRRGGGGGRQRIAVQNIYTTICGRSSMSSKPNTISLNHN